MANAVSLQPQDLSRELLLQQALKDIDGQRRPVLGGIPLLAKIGGDSTGTRYYAVHPGLERPVSVMVMPCDAPAAPRTAVLMAHANAALRVKSPRVVELLEFANEAGVLFFVTEHAQGKSAENYLNTLRAQLKPGLDEGVALQVCSAAAEGLAAVHAADLLHLDVRPANIVIPAGEGEMLLASEAKLDGLGQAYNSFAARLLAGTPAQTGMPGFMSPEQALGADSFTAACDIFSFGVTLYTLLAGQSPFDGPDLEAIISATVAHEAGSVRIWRPEVTPATAKTIEICLRKNPAERFTDASILHKALMICRNAKGGTASEQGAALTQIESLAPPVVEAPGVPAVAAVPRSPSHRVSALSTALGVRAPRPEPVLQAPEDTLVSVSAPMHEEQATVVRTLPQTPSKAMSLPGPAATRTRIPLVQRPAAYESNAPVTPRRRVRRVRRGLLIMLAAAVLLSVGGAGALQLGWLDTWIMSTPGMIEGPAATAWLAEHRRQAAENRARDKELKKEKERLAAEAATKAEQEKLAAQAKAKAEERKKKEDAKAADEAEKAERERLAAEAKAAEQRKKDEDAQAAELKAKAEKERLAAAAMAKAAEQKKEAERRAAQQAANAQPVALELAPGVKIEFVPVPGGSFRMGTDLGTLEDLAKKTGAEQQHYLDETPAHRVEVPPFYIGRSPVTVAQFRAFVAATGYKTAAERRGEAFTLRDGAWQRTPGACWKNPGFQQGDDHPVVLVSFRDCEVFAAWVARTTRRPLRLPSETEWEYAARGPNAFLYPWGGQWDGHLANHFDASLKPFGLPDWKYPTDDDGFPFTSPVGKFGNQSWCGAVDLAGNVMQWCSDTCEPYPQSSTAPLLMVDEADVPSDTPRALRGGSYLSTPLDCRAAVRRCSSPRSASCEFGVRLAFTPDARTADERR